MIEVPSLVAIRKFLVPHWAEFERDLAHRRAKDFVAPTVSTNMCIATSIFLCRYLNRKDLFQYGIPIYDRERNPPGSYGKGGFHAPGFYAHGRCFTDWRQHAWLELDGVIFDMTADQFGKDIPEINVVLADDPRYDTTAPLADIEEYTSDACWQHHVISGWVTAARRDESLPKPGRVMVEMRAAIEALRPGVKWAIDARQSENA